MALDPVPTAHPVVVGVIALVIFLVLWAAGSGLMFLAHRAAEPSAVCCPVGWGLY